MTPNKGSSSEQPADKDRDEAPRIGSGYRDWEWAAHRLGEMMCADGPKGYYLFTPQQLVDWASSLPSRTVPETGSIEDVREKLRKSIEREQELERLLAEARGERNYFMGLVPPAPLSATRTSGRTVRDAAETAEDFSGPPAIVSTSGTRSE